ELEVVDARKCGVERRRAEENREWIRFSLLVQRAQPLTEPRLRIAEHPPRDHDAFMHLRALAGERGLPGLDRGELALDAGEARVQSVERERCAARSGSQRAVLLAELLCLRADAASRTGADRGRHDHCDCEYTCDEAEQPGPCRGQDDR